MLGNDQVGDCTIAGAMHAIMLWNKVARHPVNFTTQDAIDDYSAVSGYVPGDDSTDQGADIVQVASYWRKTGIRDSTDTRHKIVAYMSVDHTNLDHIDAACYLFYAVGLGVQISQQDEDNFLAGQPWTGANTPEAYHYVPMIGRDPIYRQCVTWGGLQDIADDWFITNVQEVVAMISAEDLINGRTLEGFDMVSLQADLAEVAST